MTRLRLAGCSDTGPPASPGWVPAWSGPAYWQQAGLLNLPAENAWMRGPGPGRVPGRPALRGFDVRGSESPGLAVGGAGGCWASRSHGPSPNYGRPGSATAPFRPSWVAV